MSEETNTIFEYKYEDEFSYVTGEGNLMLKGTSFFSERKIDEVGDDDVAQRVEEHKKAFGQLEKKVSDLIEERESTRESIEKLEEELKKEAEAIGDYETLLNRLKEAKEKLEQETEAGSEESKAPEPQSGSEQPEAPAQQQGDDAEEEPVNYYQSIAEKAESLSKQSDWPYVSMELDNLSHQWNEGPEVEGEQIKKLFDQFRQVCEAFEQRKKEHYEQLKKQKQKNLEKKKELLQELSDIVSGEKWEAVKKVNQIKGQWHGVGILPSGEAEDLDKKFNSFIKEFEGHKVDRLVNKRQHEEDNLTGKLIVLDKMENLTESLKNNTSNWKTIVKEFDRLTKQYKRIGRVPPDKSDEVWQRYKVAQDQYYDRKYKYDDKHRKQVDKYHQKKEILCKKAEALLNEPDLAGAARELNKLHRRWKKIGNLPQRVEDELWSRFKSATDAFNDRKSENIDKLREQEEQNYEKKVELIERAKKVNETDNWDKGHSVMQNLMDQWKKVGPVPRNKSRKLWKQFKKAQDVFYERRREHFKDRKEEQKKNLKEKHEILEKLRELGNHKDPVEAVELAKPLQEEFKKAGYVPIKKKNEIWKQYREACDIIYERYRAAKSGNKFDRELAKADLEPGQRSQILDIRKEYKKVKKEIYKLEEEVLQFKESKTYFKSSSDDNPLLNEIQQKIDKAENNLQKKQDKLESLDREIEELREES